MAGALSTQLVMALGPDVGMTLGAVAFEEVSDDAEWVGTEDFMRAIGYTQSGNTGGLREMVAMGIDLRAISEENRCNLGWVAAGHGQAACLRLLYEVCGGDYLGAIRGNVGSTTAHAAALQVFLNTAHKICLS